MRKPVYTALKGLHTNKTRSALTILGIVIGIMAIVLVMSIGEGANALIVSQVQGLGSKTMFIVPGKDPGGPSNFSSMFSDSLKERELQAILKKANVPTLADATPMVMVPGSISWRGDTFPPTTFGASEIIEEILDLRVERGSFFSREEIRQNESVAVIGRKVYEDLFGETDAVGERVKIKGRAFRVTGVLAKKGRTGLLDVDEAVIIPYTTAQRHLMGTDHYNEIIARAASEESVARTVRDIEATIRELHDITDPEDDDFHVHTQEDIAERVGSITGVLTALLASVAAISLLVGGIGIMNIMLVSVTERTREIGLRKALGATDGDILTQFLLESVILTLIGGVVGIALGASLSFVASLALSKGLGVSWAFAFPVRGALLGVGVSLGTGLIFGIYPARQAAQKSPIEALRYE